MDNELGVDIALNDDGNINFDSKGSINLYEGINNLKQAIKTRLTTDVGTYFMTLYGSELYKVEGKKDDESRVKSLVVEALQDEDRIKSIDQVKVIISNSVVYIDLKVTSTTDEVIEVNI